jgi:hypothetical protein
VPGIKATDGQLLTIIAFYGVEKEKTTKSEALQYYIEK